MKVFVSGSRGVRELPAAAKAALDKIKALGFTVSVGDCHGVDSLVQAYLEGYGRVIVFHIGARPRTNLGFATVRVAGHRQADKDAAMADQADYGLAVWDGRSPGTARNIGHDGDQGRARVSLRAVTPGRSGNFTRPAFLCLEEEI